MTEIKIEKKNLVWPWILLGLAIVAILIYFLVFYDNDHDNDHDNNKERIEATELSELIDTEETDLISVRENNNTVTAYVNFVETDQNKMSLDHEFTNDVLLKLIEATYAIAGEVGYDVQADLEQVKEYADRVDNEPFKTTHANSIRKASDILTNALQNIQKAKYPGLTNEVEELRNATAAINPDILTLNQKKEVKAFFSKAADLLQKMN